MSMPLNILSPDPITGAFLPPDDRIRTSLLVDYELGGVAIGDPSQGLEVQIWEARVSGNTIQIRPEGSGAWTDIVSGASITEITLAFDQSMRPSITFVDSGVASFYWYDADTVNYVTSTFPGATSPVCCMDDKRTMEVGTNDVLLFYLRDGRVMHRRQRDRYLIEYDLAAVPDRAGRIRRWGMHNALRIMLEFELA